MSSKIVKRVFGAIAAATAAAFLLIWFGVFNVAATDEHWGITKAFLALVRDRSISSSVKQRTVPDLSDQTLIAAGAPNYSAMCEQCHLAPGVTTSEFYQGLNPTPPVFHKGETSSRDPVAAFWIIENGIKMTGMAAWGDTHTDAQIWQLIAFINAMPGMQAESYKSLVGDGEHSHKGSSETAMTAGGGQGHGDAGTAQAGGATSMVASGHHGAPSQSQAATTGPDMQVASMGSENGNHHAAVGESTVMPERAPDAMSSVAQAGDHHAGAEGPGPAMEIAKADRTTPAPAGGHHAASGDAAAMGLPPSTNGAAAQDDGHHASNAGTSKSTGGQYSKMQASDQYSNQSQQSTGHSDQHQSNRATGHQSLYDIGSSHHQTYRNSSGHAVHSESQSHADDNNHGRHYPSNEGHSDQSSGHGYQRQEGGGHSSKTSTSGDYSAGFASNSSQNRRSGNSNYSQQKNSFVKSNRSGHSSQKSGANNHSVGFASSSGHNAQAQKQSGHSVQYQKNSAHNVNKGQQNNNHITPYQRSSSHTNPATESSGHQNQSASTHNNGKA